MKDVFFTALMMCLWLFLYVFSKTCSYLPDNGVNRNTVSGCVKRDELGGENTNVIIIFGYYILIPAIVK